MFKGINFACHCPFPYFYPMNRAQLIEQIQLKKSFLCVGLDTDSTKIPHHLKGDAKGIIRFNKAIIDATKEYSVSYKINTAFYEAMGLKGWEIMEETLHYIPKTHFTIADAKRGDIGNTSAQYAKTFFEEFPFDAITVAPYMGEDSIRPFLEYENKWTIVLGLTSNMGAKDFQQQILTSTNAPLYETILTKVASWGTPNHLMFVIGATRAIDLATIRKIIPAHFLLVPGVGAQGGSLEEVSKYGLNKDVGLLVNASRAIIYASDKEDYELVATKVAKEYQQEMATYL